MLYRVSKALAGSETGLPVENNRITINLNRGDVSKALAGSETVHFFAPLGD